MQWRTASHSSSTCKHDALRPMYFVLCSFVTCMWLVTCGGEDTVTL